MTYREQVFFIYFLFIYHPIISLWLKSRKSRPFLVLIWNLSHYQSQLGCEHSFMLTLMCQIIQMFNPKSISKNILYFIFIQWSDSSVRGPSDCLKKKKSLNIYSNMLGKVFNFFFFFWITHSKKGFQILTNWVITSNKVTLQSCNNPIM